MMRQEENPIGKHDQQPLVDYALPNDSDAAANDDDDGAGDQQLMLIRAGKRVESGNNNRLIITCYIRKS